MYRCGKAIISNIENHSQILRRTKKAVLKNFANIHMKMAVVESLSDKVSGLQACNFVKKRLQHRCLPVNIAKFLRIPILKNICEWLLLSDVNLIHSKAMLLNTDNKYCSH